MRGKTLGAVMAVFVLSVTGLGWSSASADDDDDSNDKGKVKITPLGTHTGEFCRRDRAMLFEDPDGTTVLYDIGRTVVGFDDPRLPATPAKLDIVLLSSVHSDHIGDNRPSVLNNGTCGAPTLDVSTRPNSNTAEVVAGRPEAKLIVGGEMRDFMRAKVADAGGATSQVDILRHGGKQKVGGVTVAVITAHHSNGVDPDFLTGPLSGDSGGLSFDNLTAYVGPENGYVLTFSNGLAVYLSGDTGHTSDMAHIVRDYYGANVAIVNMGDTFSMGPEEAAFAVDKLIKPRTVIASHANEEATSGGKVLAGTKTARFINLVEDAKVFASLSGVPIECDSRGRCTQ